MTTVGLRDVEEGDRARLLAWRNAPEVAAYMYSDHVITAEEHDRWFDGGRVRADRRYWIVTLDSGPVGLANLYDVDAERERCSWAYYLADPAVRNRGVGGWVEYAVLQHVFETMKLHKLWCEVLASNEAVWRLHEAHGFRVEARFRDHVRKDGEWLEVLGLGLLASDWRAVRDERRARLLAKGLTPPD